MNDYPLNQFFTKKNDGNWKIFFKNTLFVVLKNKKKIHDSFWLLNMLDKLLFFFQKTLHEQSPEFQTLLLTNAGSCISSPTRTAWRIPEICKGMVDSHSFS